jgi:hypothetical protein
MEILILKEMVADSLEPNKPGSQGDLWSKLKDANMVASLPGATAEDRERAQEAEDAFERILFMTPDQIVRMLRSNEE